MRLLAGVAVFLPMFAATFAYSSQLETLRDDGTISGVVEYGGPPPSPVPLAITKDREVCGTSLVYDQSLVVGRDRGVTNAVVAVVDIAQSQPPKPEPAVRFDQKGCQYIPHVAVFPAGSTVVILNSDGILHNIHTESIVNPVIDLAQPGFKKEIRVTIEKPEIIKVTCDAHNWMEGWWYVTATPYYAITDGHGHYAIHNVPPGTYTLRVWQERLGTQTQRVVVKPNAATVADFTLKSIKSQGS
ncbi:MAG: carboxypeptidase regulatory-like domain-containing protein [Deltaproteobacteria bacterium]|nr:carboxypeptidase regulatory-like domain-containing protein [Deltaproteobacteria bacterium]